jgi:hypothetical protein
MGGQMSQKSIDFLLGSFLYEDKLIDECFSSISESDLYNELQLYREYICLNYTEIIKCIRRDNDALNICIESFNDLPAENLYKQLALYMDQVVIPDPLFELTENRPESQKVFSKFMGFNENGKINRKSVSIAVKYIKKIYPLISSDFVKLLPISLIYETPKELPILYSPTSFADELPKEISEYYHSIARVCNVERKDGCLQFKPDIPLVLGTTIYVMFPEDERLNGGMFQFLESKVVSLNEKTGLVKMGYHIPNEISDTEFNSWVMQSINRAAIHHFTDKYNELILSKKIGCMFLSQSQLTSNVLQMSIQKPSTDTKLASLAMNFDLPIFSQVTLEDIINIRKNYGEAFHNFRTELNAKLLCISDIENHTELQKQINRISYELNNIQVKEVEKEYRKINRTLGIDAAILTGSLLTSFLTGGLTLVGAAAAAAKGGLDSAKYFTDIREHNGFFLWKLNKQASKYEV